MIWLRLIKYKFNYNGLVQATPKQHGFEHTDGSKPNLYKSEPGAHIEFTFLVWFGLHNQTK